MPLAQPLPWETVQERCRPNTHMSRLASSHRPA
jgi:hypothetical protein